MAAPQPVRLVSFFAQRTRMVLTRASALPPPTHPPFLIPPARPNPTAYCSVADAGMHLDVALQLADAIAANGPLGVASAKAVLNDVVHRPHEGPCASALRHSAAFRLRTHQLTTPPACVRAPDPWPEAHARRKALNDTADFAEALAAFEQKRAPVFQGR